VLRRRLNEFTASFVSIIIKNEIIRLNQQRGVVPHKKATEKNSLCTFATIKIGQMFFNETAGHGVSVSQMLWMCAFFFMLLGFILVCCFVGGIFIRWVSVFVTQLLILNSFSAVQAEDGGATSGT
jgi:hypothetical protein